MAFNNRGSDDLQYFIANSIIQFKSFTVLTQNQIPLRYTSDFPILLCYPPSAPSSLSECNPVDDRLVSCSGSLPFLFYGKNSFQKTLNYFSLSQKLVIVLPHTILPSKLPSRALLCFSTVNIGPWLIVGLCFYPWNSTCPLPVAWENCTSSYQLWHTAWQPLTQFILKFQQVWHSWTQKWHGFVQAMTVYC